MGAELNVKVMHESFFPPLGQTILTQGESTE